MGVKGWSAANQSLYQSYFFRGREKVTYVSFEYIFSSHEYLVWRDIVGPGGVEDSGGKYSSCRRRC